MFAEKVHLSSGVLSILRPLGQYTEQTNAANAVSISHRLLVLSNSFLSARVLLLSVFRKALNQVFLPVPENVSILSAPVNMVKAWEADKAFALPSPRTNHIGHIYTIPDTNDTDMAFASRW